MKIDLEDRTPQQLQKLIDSAKVSDLPVAEKGKIIEEIEYRLTGRRYTDSQVLEDIEDGVAELDYSDFK